MAQEIELKYIVLPSAVDELRYFLNALDGQYRHSAPRQLLNIYFETPDCLLRRHDMGLRIRGDGSRYEMTMKTAGNTTGALHQRPEFNVPLAQPKLDLTAFPPDVWLPGLDVAHLSASLRPLFRTDFSREKWEVAFGAARVEIALDRGMVISGELSEPLSELELELLEGCLEDLLGLARLVAAQPGLRAGLLSKAARGYHLAAGNPPRPMQPLTPLVLAPDCSVECGLSAALNEALDHWVYHEELWLRGEKRAAEALSEALALIRHTFRLFEAFIPMQASVCLLDLVARAETALNDGAAPQALIYAPVTASLRQTLTEWLLLRGWRPPLDAQGINRLESPLKPFADLHVPQLANALYNVFAHPTDDSLKDSQSRLAWTLDALHILAGVYPPAAARNWLAAWRKLEKASGRHPDRESDSCRRHALKQVPFWTSAANSTAI